MAKNLPAMQEIQVQFLGQEDPLEKEMAVHSSILVWKIPWTKDIPNPGIDPGSPTLQEDSLLSDPPGKPHDVSK